MSDLSLESLKAVVSSLETRYREVVVNEPETLADEKGRLRLAFEAGRHSVVREIRAQIKREEQK